MSAEQSFRLKPAIGGKLCGTKWPMATGARLNRLRVVFTGNSPRPSFLTMARRAWTSAFAPRYLLYTNMGLSVSLACVGDVLQQWVKRSRDLTLKHDFTRTRNMSLAAVSMGFLCHHWYLYLDRFLPGRGIGVVAKKVFLDQILLSPVMWLAYFSLLACLDRSGLDQLQDRLTEKGGRLYLAEWIIWPPAQVVNFYLLPTKYRMLYDNFISLGFDWYTSYLVHDFHDDNCDKSEESQHVETFVEPTSEYLCDSR